MVDSPDTRPAAFLIGVKLEDGWTPNEVVSPLPGKSGGNFSVGYRAERIDEFGKSTGEFGFVKAIDFSKWPKFGSDPVSALPVMTSAFQFELNVVQECAGRRMRNVVRGVASGSVKIGAGILPDVNYIVFEEADGDVREHLDALTTFDVCWAMRVLHNISKGLDQLHWAKIYHQDIKPSNVLMFNAQNISERTKLGDLGRAAKVGVIAPHEHVVIAGDPLYAPPETLYGYQQSEEVLNRLASDSYHLGSMAYFLFSKSGLTFSLISGLAPALRPTSAGGTWGGTFDQALPHLRTSFDAALANLRNSLPSEIGDEIADDFVLTIRQLCDPDPRLRGHPTEDRDGLKRFAMNRFVAKFDLLTRQCEIKLRKALA